MAAHIDSPVVDLSFVVAVESVSGLATEVPVCNELPLLLEAAAVHIDSTALGWDFAAFAELVSGLATEVPGCNEPASDLAAESGFVGKDTADTAKTQIHCTFPKTPPAVVQAVPQFVLSYLKTGVSWCFLKPNKCQSSCASIYFPRIHIITIRRFGTTGFTVVFNTIETNGIFYQKENVVRLEIHKIEKTLGST